MLFLDHIKPSDFYLSCWQSTRSSVPLLLIRVLLFLTSLGIVLYSSILYMKFGWFKFWFIYLTHWGLTLNTLATGFAVAVSARCHFYGPISKFNSLFWCGCCNLLELLNFTAYIDFVVPVVKRLHISVYLPTNVLKIDFKYRIKRQKRRNESTI